ncbi:MAG: phosphotransferase family protein, partial [Pseudomonadota bacterium]
MMNSSQLNLTAVDAYLSAHLNGYEGPLEATKFDIGQSNPTFELRTPSRSYVLRRKPPGQLLKSAHAVDREFRVQRALAESRVPVPKMYLLCEDDAVIGSAFYVMEHLRGRVFPEPTLQGENNRTRTAVLDEMNRVLADLHKVDVNAVGLSDYGPAGNYFERQISRWTKQYRASETEKINDMNKLIDDLERSLPADDGQRTLVHGDYRIDNLMYAADGTNCVGVLDWELSTIGHPYAD